MKHLALIAALFLASPALAAKGNSDKLPPARPLSLTDPDSPAVLDAVNALLATLETGDTAKMLTLVQPEGGVAIAGELPDGSHRFKHMSWQDYATHLAPDGHHYSESIADPAIEVDGDIAMLWAAYRVTMDGKMMHCGFDHFDLVRVDGKWKILNITWSQRTAGCPQ